MYKNAIWAILTLLFFSCANEPAEPASGGAPPNIWAQYKVWGEEGDSVASCMLQYFGDERMRHPLFLENPAGVQLDAQVLDADSAGVVGAFYEFQAPVADFAGSHVVRFTDVNGKTFDEKFDFQPFSLTAGLPAELAVQDYTLSINGLTDGSAVRVVITDTSTEGSGINELVRVENKKIILPDIYWEQLAAGPVIVHLTSEQERPLKSKLRGTILITYGLSRVVQLRK